MPSFSPALLVEGRRLPGTPETLRRLIRALDVQPGERVLLIGGGGGTAFPLLANEARAKVTALEWEPGFVAACEARARDASLAGKVVVHQGDLTAVQGQSFESVLLDALPPHGELSAFAGQVRELLVANGRLGMTLPAAIGLNTAPEVAAFWAEELGMPLARPVALLSLLERAGFEPQWAEALADEVLTEHYRLLGDALGTAEAKLADRARAAIEHFKGAGRTGSSYAMLVARRREPGEKPPPARTAG